MISNTYQKWIVTVSTGIMIFLVNADFTIVNLALLSIAKDFSASLSQAQWVLTSYLIATVIFFIIGGRLADMLGKKRIFLFGVVLFTVGCFGAALAKSLWMLDLMRFVQGIGFAFTLGLAILLNAEAFPPHQQGLSVGISVTLTGIAQAIGPTLGGVILQWANWRWLFGYAVPLGILSFILTQWSCRPDREIIKIPSRFLSGLFDYPIFANRMFLVITAVRILYMFSYVVVLFSFPLYLQVSRGLSPLHAGLMLLIMTGMIGILSPIVGHVMDRCGYRLPMVVAVIIGALSFTSLSYVTAHTAMWQIGLMLFLFGVASGLMLTASVRGVMDVLPASSKGIGVGIFFTANFLLSALGIALATAILESGSSGNSIHIGALLLSKHFRHIIWVNLAVSLISLGICTQLRSKRRS